MASTRWVVAMQSAPWAASGGLAVLPLLLPGLVWVRTAAIGLFLVAVMLRVVVAAVSTPSERRPPMVVMSVGLALFMSAALVLAIDPGLPFPSPMEAVFGGAYICFVWFLMLDANGGRVRDLRTTLETGVIAGGIISAAVFALVVPAGARLGLDGVPLLVAMAYPIADLVLITTVLTQLLTGRRVPDRRSALLTGGLVLLAAVDISLPLGLTVGGYSFSTLQDLSWAIALAALAEAASRPAPPDVKRKGIGSIVPVGAGLCALLLLVTAHGSGPAWATQAPAALTIVLLLGLLLTSLREARRGIEAQRLSLTDDLTGIGNRRAIMNTLTTVPRQPLSLMLIDLNGFKTINDTLGHHHGDSLLAGVAERLQHTLHDADVVARLGGDEFAVIYHEVDVRHIAQRVESLLVAMCLPLVVADMNLTVNLSIGISSDEHGQAPGIELLRRADVAMYRAKASGGGYQWYDAATDNFSTENLHLVEDLRVAIGQGQLRAYYQPQVRARDGALIAVEALVRWQHPTRGVLLPLDFLPVARTAGLMLPLSLEIIRLTLAQAATWAQSGTPLRLSLNVDPPELLSGQWAPVLVAEVLRLHIDPALVTVELTEEVLISDVLRATTIISELAEHGIGVSIDDFGTGYSGLTWLQTLPVTELKLDRGFVTRVLSDPRTHHIVDSTIELANRLGIRVVAEGVEDDATAKALSGMGAHLLQGFGIGRPMTPDALESWRRIHPSGTPTTTSVSPVPRQ